MPVPRVSCLMVTANRTALARRAIRCFIEQRYENKELIVVDDGHEDYKPLFQDIPPADVRYIKLPPRDSIIQDDCRLSASTLELFRKEAEASVEDTAKGSSDSVEDTAEQVEASVEDTTELDPTAQNPSTPSPYILGTLRNLALEASRGDFLVQWDDDDWYHPDRIARQATVLLKGYDACWLSASLMHLDNPELFRLPYIGWLPDGIPGSIMHRRSRTIRYPELRRGEDTVYLKTWKQLRHTSLPAEDAGLFIRCYHGSNTWEQEHFVRRIRNSPVGLLQYLYHKYLRGDISGHPRFRLSWHHREAFELYLKQSRELGLFNEVACATKS